MIATVRDSTELSAALTSTSATAIWRLWTYVVASAIYVLEVLFDTHRASVEALLVALKPHTLQWYTNKAKEFLYGKELIPFTAGYDTGSMTADEIAAAKIVTYASATRARRTNGRPYLRIKAAKGIGDLEPLTATELAAFVSYMQAIQDAGIDLECTSEPADMIRQTWTVYYDPQILDASGNRLDGSGSDVVRQAIKNYLKQLPFNGLYVKTFHIDFLQAVAGVKVPVIGSTQVSAVGGQTWTTPPESGVEPSGGWYRYYAESDLSVNMQPYQYGENV
jgi:hypothetical protein